MLHAKLPVDEKILFCGLPKWRLFSSVVAERSSFLRLFQRRPSWPCGGKWRESGGEYQGEMLTGCSCAFSLGSIQGMGEKRNQEQIELEDWDERSR